MTFIDYKKPLENFDRIEFSDDSEITRLLKWRDNNKDLVRNFNFVLEQGVIYNKRNSVHIIFEKQNESVFLDCLLKKDGTLEHFHTILWKYKTHTVELLHSAIKNDEKQIEESNQTMITVFASLMAYMEHNIEKKENVTKNTIVSNKVKKGKNGKKKSIRKISKVIYSVNVKNVDSIQTEKRKYQITEENWTVKGHWRTKKNGEKTWVKPYSKGIKQEKKKPVTYQF